MIKIFLEMGVVFGELVGALGGFFINLATLAGDYYFLWLVPAAVGFSLTLWAVRPGRVGIRWGIWLLGQGVLVVFVIAAARVYQRPLDDFIFRYYGEIQIDWYKVWVPAPVFWLLGFVPDLDYGLVRKPSRESLPSVGTPMEPPPPPKRKKGKKGPGFVRSDLP